MGVGLQTFKFGGRWAQLNKQMSIPPSQGRAVVPEAGTGGLFREPLVLEPSSFKSSDLYLQQPWVPV